MIPGLSLDSVHINSDIVFGLLTLGGFAYAPQLADLPDQKMWRIDRTADYGAFQDADLPGGLRPLRDKDAADNE